MESQLTEELKPKDARGGAPRLRPKTAVQEAYEAAVTAKQQAAVDRATAGLKRVGVQMNAMHKSITTATQSVHDLNVVLGREDG